jgi:phenylacetate-CoA ligase
MNQYYNPFFLLKIASSYLSDIPRIWNFNEEQIKKYQDKSLRKILKYAYNVPLYHDKYKEHGVVLSDIQKIEDIHKLPFITKDDLRNNYHNNRIISKNFNKQNSFLISTSGSTGKPLFMYYDLFNTIKHLEGFIRALRSTGANWNKTRIVQIIDIEPGSAEYAVFQAGIKSFLKNFIHMENIKYFPLKEKPELLINEINDFNPEIISSDPATLQKLANLKINGYGKNINPNYITSSSSMLDGYSKKYIENAFNTRVLNYYASTETGLMAFECLKGNFHVNSDFVFLEYLDKNNEPAPPGKQGQIVTTKLYGGGTPIIRYTGLDDFVTHTIKKCNCGINSTLISEIHGRATDMILLPDNRLLTPLAMTGIPAEVMDEYQTYKIKQFQIIQHKIDEIEVVVVIDEKLRNTGPSVEKMLGKLKKLFSERVGNDVKVTVNEVDKITKEKGSDKFKVVISKIKKNN